MTSPNKITYLAGVARSGTSWLGQIFDSSPEVRFRFQPFFSYEFKDRITVDSEAQEVEEVLADLHGSETPFLTQEEKRKSGEYPTFNKASVTDHLVLKENRYQYLIEPIMRKVPKVTLVGIVRNPNGVINSWMKNPKEFPPGSQPLEEWRFGDCKNEGHQDFFGFYKWKEVAGLYLDLQEKWPERVTVLKYEDLVENPMTVGNALFDFCQLEFGPQTEAFLEQSSSSYSESYYSVYKTKRVADQWRKELDPYITSEIEQDLKGTRLEQFLS